ncbi:hypothetical protein BXZ70DRAFT_940620 [Cristinia sonorae]|uniref:Polynucleotide 5'-hydroxyl-kinase GRC3 n=1 Tax=Cristinia sonorae TaxID=1940300 RepID=A0A8K0UMN2_9AGAR|nr:hypothetical protein BXZ70DRAFT_940620 [Cristinia sonorae]
MLSAVAARKNRLQQQQSASGTASPTSRPPSPPQPSLGVPKDAELASQKPRSKRKASNPQPAPNSRKKKTKQSRAASPNPRYFQSPTKGEATPDLIIIEDEDSDEDDGVQAVPDDDSSSGSASPPPRLARSLRVSDDVNMDDDFFETPRTIPVAEVPSLSTFTPLPDTNIFYLTLEEVRAIVPQSGDLGRATILLLTASDKVALLGAFKFRVLRGLVSISGVTLHPSVTSHHVYAPRSSPLPVIEVVSEQSGHHFKEDPLPQRVDSAFADHSAAILLEELHTGVEGLGKVCRTFEDNFTVPESRRNSDNAHLGLHGVHLISTPPHSVYPFVLPDSWKVGLSSAIPESIPETDYSRKVFFVKGAKKTGKSTFSRTLLNRLSTKYRRVAYLECDPGQSEFTPGGMVALNIVANPVLGPPFTHPSIPHQAHYIGSTTPQASPSHYLAAIQALIYTYNTDIQHASYISNGDDDRIDDFIPLVVNMMGWTKGLGADLSDRIEEMLQPSAVFEFEAPVYEDGWTTPAPGRGDATPRFEAPSYAMSNPYLVHKMSPASLPLGVTPKFSPADLRQLSILSYFHAVFPPIAPTTTESPDSVLAESWDTTLPLCAHLPYEVSCGSALDLVVLVGPGSEDVVPSEVDRVLNGAIVGLISYEPDTLEVDGLANSRIPYVQGVAPPQPTSSTCHGLAFIRSVSPPGSAPLLLQMLTPIPPQILTQTPPRIIVKGDMELPVWGMLDFRSETHVAGVPRAEVPYLKWGTTSDVVGANRRRTRRNLMRKGQM